MSDAPDILDSDTNTASPVRLETVKQLAKDATPHAHPNRAKSAPDPVESFFLSEFLRQTPAP